LPHTLIAAVVCASREGNKSVQTQRMEADIIPQRSMFY